MLTLLKSEESCSVLVRGKHLVIISGSVSDIVLRNIVDCSVMLVLCSEMFYEDKLRPVKNF